MTSEKTAKEHHFLLVDDDVEVRKVVREYLEALGYLKISEANDGTEALALIKKDISINFIISDWDMPFMSGLNLLQHIRSSPTKANIPFLMVTSPVSHEAEKVILAAENLVDTYLIKPFRSLALKQKIDQALAKVVHGPQKRVVVIDDDPDAREMVLEYVQKMGFREAIGLVNGKEGLEYLGQNAQEIGLIICDWEMPEMGGIEVLKACKAHKTLSEVPFLMITSQSSIERMKVLQAAKANVDDYLLKPFSVDQIKKRVEILIEKSRTRKEVHDLTAAGLQHAEHGRYQPAQEAFEAALALDSTYDVCLRAYGDLLIKIKGVEIALPFYKKAIDANPTNPRGHIKLAMAYEQVGLLDKAVLLLQDAVKEISFSSDLHFHLGRLFNKKKMYDLARTEFEKTLELQLDHTEARLMLEMLNGKRD